MTGFALRIPGPTLMGGSIDVDGEPLQVGVSRAVIEADTKGVTTITLTVPVATDMRVQADTGAVLYTVSVDGVLGFGPDVPSALRDAATRIEAGL